MSVRARIEEYGAERAGRDEDGYGAEFGECAYCGEEGSLFGSGGACLGCSVAAVTDEAWFICESVDTDDLVSYVYGWDCEHSYVAQGLRDESRVGRAFVRGYVKGLVRLDALNRQALGIA